MQSLLGGHEHQQNALQEEGGVRAASLLGATEWPQVGSTRQMNMDPSSCIETVRGGGLGSGPGAGPLGHKGSGS